MSYNNSYGPPRSGSGLRTAGIIVVMLAVVLFVGFIFVSALADDAGGPAPGTLVCDVQGGISGLARDYNTPITSIKDIINWSWSPSPSVKAGSCHEFNWADQIGLAFVRPDSSQPQNMALFGEGRVEISIRVFDAAGDIVASKTFTVTTGFGQAEKNFSEAFLFKNLEKGSTYKIGVYHAWKDDGVNIAYPAGGPLIITIK